MSWQELADDASVNNDVTGTLKECVIDDVKTMVDYTFTQLDILNTKIDEIKARFIYN